MAPPFRKGPCTTLLLAILLAILTLLLRNAAAQTVDDDDRITNSPTTVQPPAADACRDAFEKWLLSINVADQMANPDLLACVGSASPSCCRAIDGFIGAGSPLHGCSCHSELHGEAWDMVEEIAPIVSPGSNLAYIPVARPVVMQRIRECGLPLPGEPACLATAGANATTTSDGAASSTCGEPQLNQTSAQIEYSASYARVLHGLDEYGWFNPCDALEGAQYCLARLQAPHNFMQVNYGVCVSDLLSEAGVASAIAATAPEHYAEHPPHVDCTVMAREPLDAGGICVVAVLSLLAFFVVLSTVLQRLGLPRAPTSPLGSAVACFDLIANWRQLMAKPAAGNEVDLRTLNGLRAVSMFWIILGHTLTYIVWIGGIAYPGRLINPNNVKMVLGRWFISIYSGAYFAVDTFFFLSGLLVAFLVSREVLKREGRRQAARMGPWLLDEAAFWVLYVVNRILRLVPVLAAVLFFFWKVAPSLAAGPFWHSHWKKHSEDCAKYWWADLFMMSNFVPVGNPSDGLAPTTCVGGTWYLAVGELRRAPPSSSSSPSMRAAWASSDASIAPTSFFIQHLFFHSQITRHPALRIRRSHHPLRVARRPARHAQLP